MSDKKYIKISELEVDQKFYNLVVQVDHMDPAKEQGAPLQECIVSDNTGQIKLALWGKNVGRVNEGDKIIVRTGFCKAFEGKKQITTGKFGKVEIVPPLEQA